MRRKIMACLLLCVAMSSRADLGEGLWEMDVTTMLPGMPPTSGKQTRCLTAAEARDTSNLFGTASPGCEFKNRNDNGSVYRFEIVCSGAAKAEGAGEMRYSRDSLDGEFVLRVNPGGQTMETRSRIKARRLGAC